MEIGSKCIEWFVYAQAPNLQIVCGGDSCLKKKRCSHEFNMVFDLMNFNDFYVFFGL